MKVVPVSHIKSNERDFNRGHLRSLIYIIAEKLGGTEVWNKRHWPDMAGQREHAG